jgi:crossover junction endodeoxyribonuclease RusA
MVDTTISQPLVIRLQLSLPPRVLWPNARTHWFGKARATKAYRFAAGVNAKAATPPGWTMPTAASVQCDFYFRDRRRRDRDNLLAALKAAFDGLADAGVVADDSALTYLPISIGYDRERPRVEITVTPLTA